MRRLMSWTNWIMWLGWLVLFASGVLFGFGVARAEASEPWVLWFFVDLRNGDQWERGGWLVHSAYGDEEKCELAATLTRESYASKRERDGARILERGDPVRLWTRDGTFVSTMYRCFPAMIDPRPR
jgi:hypothetical protein